jgi:hypothetical protein
MVMDIINYTIDNYLISCGLVFLVLSAKTKNKKEWLAIAILYFLLFANKSIFDRNGEILYYVRGLSTSFVAIYLMTRLTASGFYHGLILILMVAAYLALAFDVSQGRHILIYNNYGAVIHGLVFCQFLGVFPAIRNINSTINAVNNTDSHNYKNGKIL